MGGARGGHMMAQKLHLADSKNTLVQVDGEAMISVELKDLFDEDDLDGKPNQEKR